MNRVVLAILRKELLDVLRDRKTLVYMLLLPTAVIPLLMFGSVRLVQSAARQEQFEVAQIAADAETQAAWRGMVFEWFRRSEIGRSMARVDTPVARRIAALAGKKDALPEPGIATDPVVFDTWVRSLAEGVGEFRRSEPDARELLEQLEKLDPQMRLELQDFLDVAIRGYALVEFRDPSSISPAEEGFVMPAVDGEIAAIERVADAAAAIFDRRLDAYMTLDTDYGALLDDDGAVATVRCLHDSTIRRSSEACARIERAAAIVERSVVRARIEARGLDAKILRPVAIAEETDLSSPERRLLWLAGSVLPYFVVVFAFLGALYPALDIGAGEKERRTLEALLVSPAGRGEIAAGKFLAVLSASIVASVLGMAALALSYRYMLPAEIAGGVPLTVHPARMLSLLLLALPAAAAFSGLVLAVSIYARSFKEAQNYTAPLQFLLILPAVAPLIPGVEMSWKLAAVPIVNISVLARDFLKGSVHWGHYGVSLAVCVAFAAACVAFCVRQFGREEVLFRS